MNRNRSSGWPRALGQLCWLLIVAVILVGCGQTAVDRGVPPGDEGTEDPEGPPGTVDELNVELRCAPFAELHASWGAVAGATGYTLMQGSTVLHEGPAGTTSAVVTPVPGAPFEFTLHTRTEADTQGGPVRLPTITGCVSDKPPVAAGTRETMMIDEEGTAWGWGLNQEYVLAMGTESLPAPTRLPDGPTNVRKLLLRNSVGVALTHDGGVQTWGTSTEGMLGRAGTTTTTSPAPIPSLGGITDIALGEHHVLAVDSAGNVWTWGTFLGQLMEEPQLVPQAEGILAVAAGNDTSFALRTDGTVLGWGTNGRDDVLGSGEEGEFPDPSPLPGVENAIEIFAAHATLYVRRGDGSYASLGNSHRSPYRPGISEWPDLEGLTGLSIGRDFVLALDTQNQVIGWGWTFSGQLGRSYADTDTPDPPSPVDGAPLARAVYAGYAFSVAVDLHGRVHTWGRNSDHELGLDAIRASDEFLPLEMPEDVIAVEAGQEFMLALSSTGKVYSWGSNLHGQLGRTTAGSGDWSPGVIEGLEDIIQISAGQEFGLALASSGTVYSWGHSTRGELGDGTPPGQFRTLPAPVSHLTDIEKVSAGADHALALDGSGRIWAWGFGYYGSLGQGDREDQLVPVLVELPGSTVQDIAAGSYYSLFLVDGLTIGGFGRNNYWQLRNENMIDQSDQLGPVPVAFGLGIRAVFAGPGTGYAINVSNDVYAWGHNPGRIKGCCPDGASAPEIVQVDGVHDVGMVAVGGGFALFLDTEQGLAYGIGHNVNGQLGISEPSAYTGPVQLPLSGTVTHVAATRYTSALVLDGTVHVSGLNRAGILGRPNIGHIEYASTPDVPPVATGSAGD